MAVGLAVQHYLEFIESKNHTGFSSVFKSKKDTEALRLEHSIDELSIHDPKTRHWFGTRCQIGQGAFGPDHWHDFAVGNRSGKGVTILMCSYQLLGRRA